jgi:uncharacterized protein (TIGR02246 family)
MRRFRFVLAFVGVLLGAAAAGQTPSDATAIADLEQRLAKAWVTRDRAAIDAILAPDWSVTDVAGRVMTKPQVLQEILGSTDVRIESMVIDEVKVRLFGDTAVATGRTRATGSDRGKTSSVVLRFTDVFVRREGRWQAVASQGTIAQ